MSKAKLATVGMIAPQFHFGPEDEFSLDHQRTYGHVVLYFMRAFH